VTTNNKQLKSILVYRLSGEDVEKAGKHFVSGIDRV
jgi:hypothetical protein